MKSPNGLKDTIKGSSLTLEPFIKKGAMIHDWQSYIYKF